MRPFWGVLYMSNAQEEKVKAEMPYRKNSHWNDKRELQCLLIFKKLEVECFPRGKQMKLCKELSEICPLSKENLSAKICNFKSVAGINKTSYSSENTARLYDKYKNSSVLELEKAIMLL